MVILFSLKSNMKVRDTCSLTYETFICVIEINTYRCWTHAHVGECKLLQGTKCICGVTHILACHAFAYTPVPEQMVYATPGSLREAKRDTDRDGERWKGCRLPVVHSYSFKLYSQHKTRKS